MGPRVLKALSTLLRALQLILALFVVGVASFHVYQFAHNRLQLSSGGGGSGQLPHALYAIEVISCAGALFALVALLTTCLGHHKFFLLALTLDTLLTAAFTAAAVLLRGAPRLHCRAVSWSRSVSRTTTNLPSALYSTAPTSSTGTTTRASPRLLCTLDNASFALSVALAALFAATTLLSALALRAYRQRRAFGPGPANGYRARGGGGGGGAGKRESVETAYTGNTAMTGTTAGYDAPGFRGETGARVEGGGGGEYRVPPAPPVVGGYGAGGHGAGGYGAPSELESGNGRFNPSLPHAAGAGAGESAYGQSGYGSRNI